VVREKRMVAMMGVGKRIVGYGGRDLGYLGYLGIVAGWMEKAEPSRHVKAVIYAVSNFQGEGRMRK
jgi:hypothetical protein